MNAPVRRWVLLHGFTGSPGGWDDVRATIDTGGEVFCPALVGHGAGTGGATDFIAEVDRLAHAVHGAGFEGAHVCGYSLGARLALGLVVRHPALFARATLVGVHPGLPDRGPDRDARADSDERWAQLAEHSLEEFLAQWRAQSLFATQSTVPPERQAAQERVRASHHGPALAGALRALSLARMPNWRPHLPRVGLPVHLIAGELDPKFIALARVAGQLLPHSTVSVVPGAGHNVVLERPAAVAAALLS